MVFYLKLLSSLSVGSWYQNIAFYVFMVFFIYLNLDIISARAKTRIRTFKMNEPTFPDSRDFRGSPKY